MLSLLIVSLAAASVLAQSDGPAPGLNANPTDTSVARLNGKACAMHTMFSSSL